MRSQKYPEIVNVAEGTIDLALALAETLKRRDGEKWPRARVVRWCIEREIERQRMADQDGTKGMPHARLVRRRKRPIKREEY